MIQKILFLFLSVFAFLYAETVVFQDSVTPTPLYTGTYDTHIRQVNSIGIYGGRVDLRLQQAVGADSYDRHVLIKWDLTSIPATATVTSATMTFNVDTNATGGNAIWNIHEALRAWEEGTANADQPPDGNVGASWLRWKDGTGADTAWTTAGAKGLGTDISSLSIDSFTCGATTTGAKAITLGDSGLARIRKWVATPATNNGFMIWNADYTPDTVVISSAEAVTLANRPKLSVTYTLGGMSLNIWQGATSSNWSTATNWTRGVVPTASDSVVFNAGAVACSLTAASVCSTIIMTSGYSGAWKQPAGKKLTVGGLASFDGTGTWTLNDTLIFYGGLHIGSGIGAATVALGSLIDSGGGNFDIDKTGAILFKHWSLATAGKTTTVTGAAIGHTNASGCKTLTTGTGTLTLNADAFRVAVVATGRAWINAGSTINGSGGNFRYSMSNSSTILDTLPDFKTTAISFILYGNTNSSYTVTLGKVNTGTAHFYLYNNTGAAGTHLFQTNPATNDSIITSTFYLGSSTAGGTNTFGFNDSKVILTSYAGASYNTGSVVVNLNTSQWFNSGDFTWGSVSVVDPGTSVLTMTNTTGTTSVKTNGKLFYDFIQNGIGGTVSLAAGAADSLQCNDFTLTNGTFVQNTKNIRILSDFQVNGTSTATCNDTITLANDGNFGLASTSTGTMAGCHLILNGTGNLDIDNDISGSMITNLSTGASGKTTTNTGASSTALVSGTWYQSTGTFTNNANFRTRTTTVTNPWQINASATLNGTGWYGIRFSPTTAVTCTIPAIMIGGTGNLRVCDSLATSKFTVNFTGAVNVAKTFEIKNSCGTNTDTLFINTLGNSIKADTIQNGNDVASAVSVIHYGGSKDTCTVFNGAKYVLGLKKIYPDSSSLVLTGNYYAGSNAVYTANKCSLYCKANLDSITSNGRTFNDVFVIGGTLTPVDSFCAKNIYMTSGSINQNSQPIRLSGDFNLAGTGNATLDKWIILTTDSKKFRVANTGTKTTTACSLNVQGDTLATGGKLLTIGRLLCADGKTNIFTAGDSLIITKNVSGDWSGSTWISSSAGSSSYISSPADVVVNSMTVKDNYNYGTIILANDGTSTNLGNNFGWLFPVESTGKNKWKYGFTGGFIGGFKNKFN